MIEVRSWGQCLRSAGWLQSLILATWMLVDVRACHADRPNVLMLLVDDLKPALGCYGDRAARTPHLDRFASRALRFESAYCNQAVCAPSRYSLLLGAHSTRTGLYHLSSQLRVLHPSAVTLPQYFARHGYRTESLGKVFHIGHGNMGDPESFSVPHFSERVIEYLDPASTGGQLTREEAFFSNQRLGDIGTLPRGAAFESPDVADDGYADGRVATETIRRLQRAGAAGRGGSAVFHCRGFCASASAVQARRKRTGICMILPQLPRPERGQFPEGAPDVAVKRGGEIANYSPVPTKGVPGDELQRQLIHGYYASTSYVDAQIGRVLEALESMRLDANTIVVIWGDHGFHLGDLGIWTKHTNYEQANRIPLLISAPGVTQGDTVTGQLAESVDLYPTLAELAGLPKPDVPQGLDGLSLVPVLRDPEQRVRDHAYHVYPKAMLGRAIRTERYRLVEWNRVGAPESAAVYELYDYSTSLVETRNLAQEQPELVDQLKQLLRAYPVLRRP